MTVQELIEELQKLPPQAEVWYIDDVFPTPVLNVSIQEQGKVHIY